MCSTQPAFGGMFRQVMLLFSGTIQYSRDFVTVAVVHIFDFHKDILRLKS